MNQPFGITQHQPTPRITVFRLRGNLDAAGAQDLVSRASAARAAGSDVVIALAQVSFIASSGVGAVLALAEEFRLDGRSLRIAAPSPPVDSVLRLLNLAPFLDIDVDEATSVNRLAA